MKYVFSLMLAFILGFLASILLFSPVHSAEQDICGVEALYAGMIMHERQYNPENREKIEDDFANTLLMIGDSQEKKFTVARMRWIFELAFREDQGIDNDIKDERIADFVTETYNDCKARE